jgi:hypothetical protein
MASLAQRTQKFAFVKDVVYRVPNGLQFRYVKSLYTGNYLSSECIPCHRNGNPLKEYEQPIPIPKSDLKYPIWGLENGEPMQLID